MLFGRTGILLLAWENCRGMAAPKSPLFGSDDGFEEESSEDTSSVEYPSCHLVVFW